MNDQTLLFPLLEESCLQLRGTDHFDGRVRRQFVQQFAAGVPDILGNSTTRARRIGLFKSTLFRHRPKFRSLILGT